MLHMNDEQWIQLAKGLLKSEIARRDLNYVEVSEKLKAIGIDESPQNISNKIGRGKFSAIFMLQILKAIGCEDLNLK